MLLTSKPEAKEAIVQFLSKGAMDSVMLQGAIQKEKKITKQGFYKALRELIQDEVVTKNKQAVYLSSLWLQKLKQFANTVEEKYLSQTSREVLSMQEGDVMTFRFKSILDLDLLWVHYFYMVTKQLDLPVLFYNPHEFWSLFRSDIQSQLYEYIRANKKKVYMVVGGTSSLDKETTLPNKKYGLDIAYEAGLSLARNTALTVIGDYVFHTVVDHNIANAIDELYQKHHRWEPIVQDELQSIISRMKRSKVVIERNAKRAEMLRKKLMKHFVFYKTKGK